MEVMMFQLIIDTSETKTDRRDTAGRCDPITRTFIPKAAINSICSGRSSDFASPLAAFPPGFLPGQWRSLQGMLDEAYSIG
jgi:hypothetical protein